VAQGGPRCSLGLFYYATSAFGASPSWLPVPTLLLTRLHRSLVNDNAGKLVACGLLYLDGGEELTVGGAHTLEVRHAMNYSKG
jgi:hypothetical protein